MRTNREPELAAILQRVKLGDREAWSRLVESQARRLYSIAWTVTRDNGVAEDVVQEVFLRIAQHRVPRLRPGAGEAFLARMAASSAIDALRRAATRKKREKGRAMSTPEAMRDDPADRFASDEIRAEVDAALESFPAETRAALWLHLAEGESIRRVASALSLPRSTVADRVRWGKARLQQALSKRGVAFSALPAWPSILRQGAPPEMPTTLSVRLEGLSRSLPASSSGLGSVLATGGVVMNAKTYAAVFAALLILGVGFLLTRDDSIHQSPPLEVTRESEPAAVSDDSPPTDVRAVVALPTNEESEETETDEPERVEAIGFVFDSENHVPIEGVRVEPLEDNTSAAVETGEEGLFRLHVDPDEDVRLKLSAPGYAQKTVPAHPGEFVAVSLVPLLEVTGWVVDADNDPIEGARIAIRGTDRGASRSFVNSETDRGTESADDGSFTLALKVFGQPRLCVFKPGYGGTVVSGTSPGARGVVVRVPRGATLRGRLVDPSGVGVPDSPVIWRTVSPRSTRWRGEARTDDAGNFEFVGVPAPATHRLFVHGGEPSEVRVTSSGVVEGILLELPDSSTEIDEPPAEPEVRNQPRDDPRREFIVHGKVLEPDGTAIPHSLVRVVFRSRGNYSSDTFTDGDGVFIVRGSPPVLPGRSCDVDITVVHRNWAFEKMTVEDACSDRPNVESAAEVELGPYEIILEAGTAITGKVVTPRGDALAGAHILLYEDDKLRDVKFFGATDEEGDFAIEHRRADRNLRFLLFHPDYATLEIKRDASSLENNGTIELGTLVLRPGGTIRGVVLRADESPAANVYVVHPNRFPHAPASTDAQGRFTLEHVTTGRHVLRVTDGDPTGKGWPLSDKVSVEIVDGATETVVLRLRG